MYEDIIFAQCLNILWGQSAPALCMSQWSSQVYRHCQQQGELGKDCKLWCFQTESWLFTFGFLCLTKHGQTRGFVITCKNVWMLSKKNSLLSFTCSSQDDEPNQTKATEITASLWILHTGVKNSSSGYLQVRWWRLTRSCSRPRASVSISTEEVHFVTCGGTLTADRAL